MEPAARATLEQRRRSLVMASPNSPGLSREESLLVIEDLQRAERSIVDLERRLHEAELTLQDQAVRRHPTGSSRR